VNAIAYAALGMLAGLLGAFLLLRAIARPSRGKALEIAVFCGIYSIAVLALADGDLTALGLAWLITGIVGLTLTTAITTARGIDADR
jgi:hypothetical protein